MTAYTITGATATANVSTDFTPNGIPTTGDTLTIGASKTLTIPAGYTFSAQVTMGGSSTSARSKIINNGTLQVRANATINSWSNFEFNAGSTLDVLVGFQCLMAVVGSTNVPYSIIATGTEADPVVFTQSDYVSGTPAFAFVHASGSSVQGGLLDATYLIIENMFSFQYGGGNSAGNHYRLNNVALDGAGYFANSLNSNLANDFIFNKVDYRHTHVGDVTGLYLAQVSAKKNTAGTPTGVKTLSNFTITHDNPLSTKIFRFLDLDYVVTSEDFIIDEAIIDVGAKTQDTGGDGWAFRYGRVEVGVIRWNGLFKNSVFVMDSAGDPLRGNYHLFDNRSITGLEDNFIEGIVESSSITDGSDWFVVPLSGSVSVKRNIVLDDRGGAFVNNLGAVASGLLPSTASVAIEHNTVLSKSSTAYVGNAYGTIFRTETNGYYTDPSLVTLQSNITGVINNLSPDGQVAAILLVPVQGLGSIVPINQVDVMDYNTYWNMVTAPPTNLFRNIVTTGKTIGDDGFGMHDNYVNPTMTNYPSRTDKSVILAFAATKGHTTTKQLWADLLRKNGFNETTRRQETAHIINYGAADIIDFAKYCVTPTNSLLATSAHDGTSRGAVQFTVSSGGGLTSSGLTSIGLTRIGLTSAGF